MSSFFHFPLFFHGKLFWIMTDVWLNILTLVLSTQWPHLISVPWDALEGINQITLDTHLAPKADLIWNRCLEDCPVNQHCFLKILAFETAHKLVFLINFNVRSLCFHRVSDWGLRQFWSIQQYSVKRNTGGPPGVTRLEEKPPRQFQSIGRCELWY